jgi:hypothetical protein
VRYYGVCYCPPKHCGSFSVWAWWLLPHGYKTYVSDITTTFFLRVFGIEFKVLRWVSRDKRTYCVSRPGDCRVVTLEEAFQPR